MPITLSQEKSIESFMPLIGDLKEELGERFSVSMHNWCGIGDRPYPLPVWEVFLARNIENKVVGVCSYYRQQEDPIDKYWIGWIGVLKAYRRKGIARVMLEFILQQVKAQGAKELWVYTDQAGAEALYKSFDFQPAGQFFETGLRQAAARGHEAVLRMDVR
jgi:GNAT superfamily N-acetyltransferase